MTELLGDFKGKFESGYKNYIGTRVEIKCQRYEVYKKLIEAIEPILAEDNEWLKKYDEKKFK